MFAAAHNSNVKIFSVYEDKLRMMYNLRGHKDRVLSMCWSENDSCLYTSSSDGAIIEWSTRNGQMKVEFSDERYQWSDIHLHPDENSNIVYAMGQLVSSDEPRSSLVEIRWQGSDSKKKNETAGCDGDGPEISNKIDLWKRPESSSSSSSSSVDMSTTTTTTTMTESYHTPHTQFKQFIISKHSRKIYVGSSDERRCGSVRAYAFPLSSSSSDARSTSSITIHGGGITSMCTALSSEEELLFTVSDDGSLAITSTAQNDDILSKKDKDSIMTYVRDVLVSREEIQKINDSIHQLDSKVKELTLHNEFHMRAREKRYSESLQNTRDKIEKEKNIQQDRLQTLRDAISDMNVHHDELLRRIERTHREKIADMDSSYKQKIDLEKERCDGERKRRSDMIEKWKSQRLEIEQSHEKYMEEVNQEFHNTLNEENKMRTNLKIEREKIAEKEREHKEMLEEDASIEIREIKSRFDCRLQQEQKDTQVLEIENEKMRKREDGLKKEIRDQREEIKSLLQRERERNENIKSLEKDILAHRKEIREREDTIRGKESRIYDLKTKGKDLEKFKFVLDYKIKELRRQIEPRMNEISKMRTWSFFFIFLF